MDDLKTTAEGRARLGDGYPCPECGKDTVRTQVSLTVDIPSALEHHLSKRNIATRDVVIMGASWGTVSSYCPCGWNMSLLKTRFDTLLAENAKLRAVAEAAKRADVVIHFDLQRMVTFGPDYNQAVKDVGDALHEALEALEAP